MSERTWISFPQAGKRLGFSPMVTDGILRGIKLKGYHGRVLAESVDELARSGRTPQRRQTTVEA